MDKNGCCIYLDWLYSYYTGENSDWYGMLRLSIFMRCFKIRPLHWISIWVEFVHGVSVWFKDVILFQTKQLSKHLRTGVFPGRSDLIRDVEENKRPSNEIFFRGLKKKRKKRTRKCWRVHRCQGLLLHMDRVFVVKISLSWLHIWRSMLRMVFINNLSCINNHWTCIKLFGRFWIFLKVLEKLTIKIQFQVEISNF